MRKIEVKKIGYGYAVVMNEDGQWCCPHTDVEIIEPCCTSPDGETGYFDCDCVGQRRVYCNQCRNDDMTPVQANYLLDAYERGEL